VPDRITYAQAPISFAAPKNKELSYKFGFVN